MSSQAAQKSQIMHDSSSARVFLYPGMCFILALHAAAKPLGVHVSPHHMCQCRHGRQTLVGDSFRTCIVGTQRNNNQRVMMAAYGAHTPEQHVALG